MCRACNPARMMRVMTDSEQRQCLALIGNVERGIWKLSDTDHDRIVNTLIHTDDWLTVVAIHAELNRLDQ